MQPRTKEDVSIAASQRVYGLFAAYNYSPWQALAEFIDNSVSSWLALSARARTDERLRIDIRWDSEFGTGPGAGKLVIEDNAGGISTKDLDRAFQLATPPLDLTRLNQFGVGMKVAASWFARHWTVETSAIGEHFQREIEWNTNDIVQRDLSSLPISRKKARADLHFTRITLTQLNHAPGHPLTIKKIKDYLPKQFRRFIKKGWLTLSWNGEVLEDNSPQTLVAPSYNRPSSRPRKWEQKFTIKLDNGMKVRGYARLFNTWAKQHTALNCFWRDRLIQGNTEPFYRPTELFGAGNSFRTGRLSVELEASDFKVTSDKKSIDFGRSNTSEGEILEKVREALSSEKLPLLQQAENYRSGRTGKELVPAVIKALTGSKATAEKHGERFLSSKGGDAGVDQAARITSKQIAVQIIRHPVGRSVVAFEVKCTDAGPHKPWVSIEWDTARRRPMHRVSINIQHAFVRKHLTNATVPIFIGMAVSSVYGEFKARTLLNDKASLVGEFTDQFLRIMARQDGIENADQD